MINFDHIDVEAFCSRYPLFSVSTLGSIVCNKHDFEYIHIFMHLEEYNLILNYNGTITNLMLSITGERNGKMKTFDSVSKQFNMYPVEYISDEFCLSLLEYNVKIDINSTGYRDITSMCRKWLLDKMINE